MEKSISLLTEIKQSFGLKEVDIRTYSPLTLAYIGDAVYDLIFRTAVVQRGNCPVNRLHHQTIRYVKAPAQAVLAQALVDEFSDEERVRKGHRPGGPGGLSVPDGSDGACAVADSDRSCADR